MHRCRGCQEGNDVDVVLDAGDVFGKRPTVSVAVRERRLQAVKHEDLLFVWRDGDDFVSGFERFDEDGGHLEEGTVIEIAIVTTCGG